MTWQELLKSGQERLKNAGVPEAELDGWYLFEAAFGISRARYYLCAGEEAGTGELPETEERTGAGGGEKPKGAEKETCDTGFSSRLIKYEEFLFRRADREPLQQILGVQEFMGLPFFVNRHVLIPRQDTETLVETVLREQREKEISILDLCTGSGCIAVSLAVLGGYAHVTGADISEEALKVARQNAKALFHERFSDRREKTEIEFRKSDLLTEFGMEEQFQVIVSNPPYIPTAVIEGLEPEVREFEPWLALDGEEDGLAFYRRLSEECGAHLSEGGCVYFEIGYDQGEAVCELLRAHGFTDTRVIQDLAGKDRVVFGRKRTGRLPQEDEEEEACLTV